MSRIKIYEGEEEAKGKWGVEEDGATIYEPMFPKRTAQRIAQLERRKNPPRDWEETKDILVHEGYTL